jgi:hypothetical protein
MVLMWRVKASGLGSNSASLVFTVLPKGGWRPLAAHVTGQTGREGQGKSRLVTARKRVVSVASLSEISVGGVTIV